MRFLPYIQSKTQLCLQNINNQNICVARSSDNANTANGAGKNQQYKTIYSAIRNRGINTSTEKMISP